MSERGIQIEGNVFCPVCECYMSQEIICNRKNAETQDPRAFIARIIIVQSCGVSGGFYASDPGQTDPVAIFRNDLFDSVDCFTVNDFDLSRDCRQDGGSHESFRLSKYDNLKICNSVVGALGIQMIVPHHLLKEKGTRADAFIILTSLLLLKQRL